MKKLQVAILSSAIAASSLLANFEAEKNQLAKITKMPANTIEVVEVIEANKGKVGLAQVVFKVPQSPFKNIAYKLKDKMILGQVFDANGVSITKEDGMKLNADVIEAQKAQKASKDVKAVEGIKADKFKDIIITLEGENKDGKNLYVFTDPLCPYCQKFEKQQMPQILKTVKSIKVVYRPLVSIPGHETALDRSAWGVQKLKSAKTNEEKMKIMHEVSTSEEYKKSMDNKEVKKYKSTIQAFMDTGLVNSTPTVVFEDGSSL